MQYVLPQRFTETLSEVLSEPIPYKNEEEINLKESFFLVCDYPFVEKGLVLFCLRPGESRVSVQGFLPDATDLERAAFESLLARNTSGKAALYRADLERSQLRPCDEAHGVQRLMDLKKMFSERQPTLIKPNFH